jgi:hypothetical protein
LVKTVLVLPHFALVFVELGSESFEVDGLLGGFVDLEAEDVVQPLDLLDGVVEFGLSFSVSSVEFANGLFVAAVLLLCLKVIGVVKFSELPVELTRFLQSTSKLFVFFVES